MKLISLFKCYRSQDDHFLACPMKIMINTCHDTPTYPSQTKCRPTTTVPQYTGTSILWDFNRVLTSSDTLVTKHTHTDRQSEWERTIKQTLLLKGEELGAQIHPTFCPSSLNCHSNAIIQHQYSGSITKIKNNNKCELNDLHI